VYIIFSTAHHFEGLTGFEYVYIEFYVCILHISIVHHFEGVTGLDMCTSNSTCAYHISVERIISRAS